MSMSDAVSRFPECPSCGFQVWDYEPGVSSAKHEGQLWHPSCLPEGANDERFDLTMHRLEKSLKRQTWMREASTLLLRDGITANLTQWARAAFEDGKTPTEFLALVKDEKVAV